ncbi:MAG: hypothetical protein BWY11_01035 [Firmicutes bacterium ADurb.Bin182]|nr:MAG: hypothetical protein BWY11_01035 [Firmicutes bacterium ADurb.Bin182]
MENISCVEGTVVRRNQSYYNRSTEAKASPLHAQRSLRQQSCSSTAKLPLRAQALLVFACQKRCIQYNYMRCEKICQTRSPSWAASIRIYRERHMTRFVSATQTRGKSRYRREGSGATSPKTSLCSGLKSNSSARSEATSSL